MNKFTCVSLALVFAATVLVSSNAEVHPEERLYFSMPINLPIGSNNQQANPNPANPNPANPNPANPNPANPNPANPNPANPNPANPNPANPNPANPNPANPNPANPNPAQAQQPQLAIRPLGQALGNFLTNVFGGAPAGSQLQVLPLAQALSQAFQPGAQLNVMPFGQTLGIILKAIFG